MTAVQPQLELTDYGNCPECGQPMGHGDELHTWTDGLSDVHAACCDCWDHGQ